MEVVFEHVALVSFLIALLIGNTATLIYAVTVGAGLLNPIPVLIWSIAGNVLRDIAFYYLGKASWVDRFAANQKVTTAIVRVKRIQQRYANHDLKIFVAIKFVYGLRQFALTYFGNIRYPVGRFLVYNTIAVIILNASLVFAGWGVSRGLISMLDAENFYRIAMGGIVVVVVLLAIKEFAVRRWDRATEEEY